MKKMWTVITTMETVTTNLEDKKDEEDEDSYNYNGDNDNKHRRQVR